jgi:biopolymer transport protein ExbB
LNQKNLFLGKILKKLQKTQKMSTQNAAKKQKSGSGATIFAYLVIPVALIVCEIIFHKVFGDGSHFEGGTNEGHPLPGDYLGVVYKGGFVVPLLMTLFLLVFTFSIERGLALIKSAGKKSNDAFVRMIQKMLGEGKVAEAIAECDKQGGSLANVVQAGLHKYQVMMTEEKMDKEQKMLAIQKELEETTALELPGLEKNLVVIATISNIGTLIALLGTVLGMIRAFAALANAGAPDSAALATGISEALINTAIGIATSAIAIIMYNLFTTRIDKLTYAIEEAGFSIVQTFAANNK